MFVCEPPPKKHDNSKHNELEGLILEYGTYIKNILSTFEIKSGNRKM